MTLDDVCTTVSPVTLPVRTLLRAAILICWADEERL
jgi:hypothetical protein